MLPYQVKSTYAPHAPSYLSTSTNQTPRLHCTFLTLSRAFITPPIHATPLLHHHHQIIESTTHSSHWQRQIYLPISSKPPPHQHPNVTLSPSLPYSMLIYLTIHTAHSTPHSQSHSPHSTLHTPLHTPHSSSHSIPLTPHSTLHTLLHSSLYSTLPVSHFRIPTLPPQNPTPEHNTSSTNQSHPNHILIPIPIPIPIPVPYPD